MRDLRQEVKKLDFSFKKISKLLKFDEKKRRFEEIIAKSKSPSFWEDKDKARKLVSELGELKKEVEDAKKLADEINILLELSKRKDSLVGFDQNLKRIEEKLKVLRLKTLLSGQYDIKNAIVGIHAGQGGVEAMDWASMLYRMYLKFCERKGWSTDVLDYSQGEEAGIKSVIFKVEGLYSYGYLKGEAGTHRLVRQSPFNADRLRQTSFALVEVLPELDVEDFPQYEIKEKDLEWQFFRSSSQGGQNVQKVSTAVRLKHKPTGIVVNSQSQRYQEQNRKIALNLLRAKLWVREKAMKEKKVKELKGDYRPASWGNQIRSYVLHPYKMVKDLRTNVETQAVDEVLNGEIDNFIEAELKDLTSK